MKSIAEIAPLVRIFLFVLGGWLQGRGANVEFIRYIQTDPDVISTLILVFTGLWYAMAKFWNWKR